MVADHDRQVLLAGEHVDLEPAGLLVVGVHDDVGAGLGDGQLDVREDLRVELERLAEATEGMPHDRDVLGSSRQG